MSLHKNLGDWAIVGQFSQGGNLSERLQTLVDSPQFKNLRQQLSQQMSQLGVKSNIRNLARERR